MPLSEYQRAGLRHHKHSAADVIDPESGDAITEGGLGGGDVAAADITDATAVGIDLITAASQAAGRTALGLGTASTQATGAFEPAGVAAADITDGTAAGRALLTAADAAAQLSAIGAEPAGVAAADITDSTTVGRAVLTAADEAAARSAIGVTASPTWYESAYGSPPSSPSNGDIWVPSDGYHDFLRRESGVWVPYISGVQGAIPPSSGWSWVNQQSSTIDEAGAAHVMRNVVNETNPHIRIRSAPATPYVITAAVRLIAFPGQAGAIGYPSLKLVHRESSSGKLYTSGIQLDHTQGMASAWAVDYWTNESTFNSRPTGGLQYGLPGLGFVVWLRIADDGTNRKYSFSVDGRNFYELVSIARTTNMTADQVGWMTTPHSSNDSAGGTIATLLSWKVT